MSGRDVSESVGSILRPWLAAILDVAGSAGKQPGDGGVEPPVGHLVGIHRSEDGVLAVSAQETDEFGDGGAERREYPRDVLPAPTASPFRPRLP